MLKASNGHRPLASAAGTKIAAEIVDAIQDQGSPLLRWMG
jgi:hypothetical protein